MLSIENCHKLSLCLCVSLSVLSSSPLRPSSAEPVSWNPFCEDRFVELQSEDSMFGREFDQLQRGSAGSEWNNNSVIQ